ncbi:MAG: GAF domain-containing protein [Chloroflexia bacterium]|nr:GAF domain-containing protein [Chloroflexia bacterium]
MTETSRRTSKQPDDIGPAGRQRRADNAARPYVSSQPDREVRELRALLQITKAASASLDLETVLEQACRHSAQGSDCSGAFILNYDRDNGTLHYISLWAPGLPRIARERILSAQLHIERDTAIAVQAVKNEEPVVVADSQNEPMLHQLWHATIGRGSLVATPLHDSDGVTGALVLFEQFPEESIPGADPPRVFTRNDVPFVTAVADQVSRAINNARRYSETERARTQRLAEIDALIETISDGIILLDTSQRVVRANRAVERMFGGDIPLRSHTTDVAATFQFATNDGQAFPADRLPGIQTLAGEPVREAELSIHRPDGNRAFLSVTASPIVDSDGRLEGALLLFRDITTQVNRERQAAAFQTISQHLASSELDIDTVVDTVVERISESIDPTFISLMLFDPDQRVLRHAAARNLPDSWGNIEPLDLEGSSLAALAARLRLTVAVPDFDELPEGMRPSLDGHDDPTGSAIIVPLIARNELLGTLGYGRPGSHTFSDSEISFLEMIAAQCALTVHNAKLYQQRSEQQAFLAEVVDRLPASLIVFERFPRKGPATDYRITMTNASASEFLIRIIGAEQDTSIGASVRRTNRGHAARELIELLDAASQDGAIRRFDELPADDGKSSRRYWSGTIVPLQSRAVTGELLLLATDVTEQVNTRRRIENLVQVAATHAAELEATVGAIADAVLVCDPDGKITLANHVALASYGVDSLAELEDIRTITERGLWRDTGAQRIPSNENPLNRALRGETLQDDYTQFDHQLGRDVYRRVSAAPVKDAEDTIIGAVALSTDITSLVELDQLKDEFFTVVTHELRTPLTTIKGYGQMLVRQIEAAGATPPRALIALREQSDRMERLINQLLDVARIDTDQLVLRPAEMDIVPLVEQIAADIGRETDLHQISVEHDEASFVGVWDRDRVTQVFTNLLTNAVNYSPDGGSVEITMRRQNHCVAISVSDQGIGIPPDQISHLFNRYSRLHTQPQHMTNGLGVGLYITKRIVDAHGGEIDVSSEPGKGTTFTVTLPFEAADNIAVEM